jgi:hypothetical protein
MEDPDATTDNENEEVEPSEPLWRQFEKQITELYDNLAARDYETSVTWNVTPTGALSDVTRQVDVLIEGTLAGEPMQIAVECKRYARRLGIGKVDEFAGKLLDLNVELGILYTINGYTAQAEARAKGARHPKIQVYVLTEPVDVDSLLDLNCPNEDCYSGTIRWAPWTADDGKTIEAEHCWSCGTFALTCVDCDAVVSFFWDTQECENCSAQYSLITEPGEADYSEIIHNETVYRR